VLHDLRLAVDDDRPPRQLVQRHVMALAVELEMDAAVHDALPLQPLADAGLAEELDGALFEHSRADAVLAVVAAPVLEHDRLDALELQKSRERQPGRAGADDPDLRSQPASSVSTWTSSNAVAIGPSRHSRLAATAPPVSASASVSAPHSACHTPGRGSRPP